MTEFLASLDRKRLIINVIGYIVIMYLFLTGPRMEGVWGGVVRGYLIIFPAYYLGFSYLRYKAGKGDKS